MEQLLVPGHTLVREGKPFRSQDCDDCQWQGPPERTFRYTAAGWGHGRCTCGQESGHLPSANGRKRWHREHKLNVLAVQGSQVRTP